MMKTDWRFWVFCASALLLSCSSDKVSGTATDTENTIAGNVVLSDSSCAGGVFVRQVLAKSAVSSAYLETRTDVSGEFAFDSALADTVNLEFRYEAEDSSLLQTQIVRNVTAKSQEKLRVRLKPSARISGTVETSEASSVAGSHFFVYLESTTFLSDVFAPDSFSFDAPEGDFFLTIAPADSGVVAKLKSSGYADSSIVRRVSVSLSAGDSLDVGNLRWSLSADEPTAAKVLRGVVVDFSGRPLRGVSAHVVTDLYGLGVSDSSAFVTQAVSDSAGVWTAVAPAHGSVSGEFRVEFRGKDSSGKAIAGVSPYISGDDLAAAADTLRVGTVRLSESASFLGTVFLVTDGNSKRDTLCWAYGIRVGFRGTSQFKTVSSCNDVLMTNLPPDSQELVYYSSDEIVVKSLKSGEFAAEDYIQLVPVNLPAGDTLKYQGFTYTPPSTASTVFGGGE